MDEKEFYRFGDEIIDSFMERWPVVATQLGVHEQDDMLADYREQSIWDFYEKLESKLEELKNFNRSSFSKEAEIDYILLRQLLKSLIRDHKNNLPYQKNPNNYIDEIFSGIMSLIMKDFAPLDVRLKAALGRMKQVPDLFDQARKNLVPERVPPVWIDLSLQQLQMAPGLFTELLPGIAGAEFPGLKDEFDKYGEKAARAAVDFQSYLKDELGYKAKGEFAVGEECFNQLLKENHLVDYDVSELLEIGQEIFAETEMALEKLAGQIAPGKSVDQILDEAKSDHPEAKELLAKYRESMEASRNFVEKQGIATIPEAESLRIIETPGYLRPIIPYAAYIQPEIFSDNLEGLFLVTPVDMNASEEKQEAKLRGHYNAKLPITTLHEGYPGHHLQLSWAKLENSNIRKLGSFLSTLFVEGWAFYCEGMMEDLGYINRPIQKLGRLSDQLWRAGRIILDVKLHCQGMSVDSAVDFLVNECRLERDDARTEVIRYTTSPTQPQSYLMGKREITKIIEDYRLKEPELSLKRMHDNILKAGSLPPELLRKELEL